ncbi:hypothetical protein GGS20DRAFT_563860 [Poronia punctata]|nr:hypothetical protein GGS20DRAFT_563860 [Poronia punctata]
MAGDQRRPASQKLPLATVLNSADEHRDSAYFSSTDASSKHNSTASGVGNYPYHHAQEKTPSPTSTTVPQSFVAPHMSVSSHMSVASMVSPTSPTRLRLDRPQSRDSFIPTGAMSGAASIAPDSRRESVGSGINQNFGDLRLGGSPYASANQSTTSIHAGLVPQRNARGLDHLAVHRISNGYQPERTPDGHPKARTAPAITGPASMTIARAAEPIKGQAWAFPEDEIAHRLPSSSTGGTFLDSRRSSLAESIASSQFTADSRLPPGQRRLEDGVASDFQTVHHHTLVHRSLTGLQSEETSPHSGSQPYSRTPELRVSHKLAERKRRTEMKELFDHLRNLMPQERGAKASKWEILSRAISEHQRQAAELRTLNEHYQSAMTEVEHLRAQLNQLRNGGPAGSGATTQITSTQQQHASSMASQDGPWGPAPRPSLLPPLRSLGGSINNGTESMTGVQYEGQSSGGGYRAERF